MCYRGEGGALRWFLESTTIECGILVSYKVVYILPFWRCVYISVVCDYDEGVGIVNLTDHSGDY